MARRRGSHGVSHWRRKVAKHRSGCVKALRAALRYDGRKGVYGRRVGGKRVRADFPSSAPEPSADLPIAYLNRACVKGLAGGGEWLWWLGCWLAPWMPGRIWVRDRLVGDVMVDRSVRVE